MTDLSRRAILGAAAVAPVAAVAMGSGGGPVPTPSMPPMYTLNPTGPSPLGSIAGELASSAKNFAQEATGLGPWLKLGMDEAKWHALRAYRSFISNRLERASYGTDHQVEAMKSWAPHFKETVRGWKKDALYLEMQAVDQQLDPRLLRNS